MEDPMDWRAIERALEEMGRGSRSGLARALGMDRSQLAKTLRKRDYPKLDQARVIDAFLAGKSVDTPQHAAANETPSRVPLYGFAAASSGDRIAFNDGSILDWVDLPRGMSLKGEFFVVQTFGSSMEPRIWAGERKLIQRNVPPAREQDAVIEFNDGTGVLKTFKLERDGQVFAHQYNPDQGLRYDSSTVKAIHAVFPL